MQEESSMDRKPAKASTNQNKLANNLDWGLSGSKLNTVKAASLPIQDSGFYRGRQNRRRGNGSGYRGDRRRQFNFRDQDRRCNSYRPNPSAEKDFQVNHAPVGHQEHRVDVPASRGRRGQNLNHLLNFTIAPRHQNDYGPPVRRALRRSCCDRPKYNKEQFLLANCQFVVRENEDYNVHLDDPDLIVNWDLIEQLRLRSNEAPSCPICLYPPTAAKITRCGHIYCWPCILHYLALSDKAWRKCPICDEMVHQADLKSVAVISYHQPVVGEEITFSLMRRGRNDTIAVPVNAFKEGISRTLPNLQKNHPIAAYSKLLTASYKEVLDNIIALEKAELLAQLHNEKDAPEACFIERALALLEERCQNLEAGNYILRETKDSFAMTKDKAEQVEEKSPLSTDHEKLSTHSVLVYESAFDDKVADPDANQFLDVSETLQEAQQEQHLPEASKDLSPRERNLSEGTDNGTLDESEVTSEDLDISKLQKGGSCNLPKSNFYFYQATDGQLIFLHALNVHMLVSEYGSLEHCPLTLRGRILELEGTTMNETLRSKLRYLSHLPVTTTFQVAEVYLKSPYLQQSTINKFHESLEKRRRDRTRRARSEKKREKRISQEEKKKWAAYPVPETIVKSEFHHPVIGTSQVSQAPLSSSNTEEKFAASSSEQTADTSDAPKSFAQMLREGKTQPRSKIAAWNTGARPASPPAGETRVRKDNSESDDDWVPPPEYHLSFGNAIALAMQNSLDLAEGATSSNQSGGRKKKKKGKTQLLFSTSMARDK